MSKDAQAFFQQTPWCAQILADPAFAATDAPNRIPKADGEDSFFAKTLATPETIERCLALYRIPSDDKAPELQEVVMLLTTGHGLYGYPGVLEGGFVATVLDEVTGLLISLSKRRRVATLRTEEAVESFTAYLNVTFKKPVPTPGVLLARAVAISVTGRKRMLKGTIEDGQGTVYATAEVLYVDVYGRL